MSSTRLFATAALLATCALSFAGCASDAKVVAPTVTVDLQPQSVELKPGGKVTFVGTVTGGAAGVSYSVTEAQGGTIDSTGAYTAPAALGVYHVVGTSAADVTAKATSTVTVTSNPAVSVIVTPTAPQVLGGGSITFTAAVLNTADTAVAWSVQEGATGGAITSAGVYTAPAAAGTYHVIAASHADSTKTATVPVVVSARPAITVTITPHAPVVVTSGAQAFTAAVANSTDTAVAWSVQEGASGGVITPDGVYTAPATVGSYHVVAASHADATRKDTVTVGVQAPGVLLTPSKTMAVTGKTRQFTGQVLGTPAATINWTIQEGAAGGTISAAGLYTAPATEGTFHVIATSSADSSKTATAVVTTLGAGKWINVTPSGVSLDPANTVDPGGSGSKFNYGAQEVMADPANPGTFYVTFTYQGVWKSVDFGATWTRITPGTNAMDNGRPAMEIAPDGSYLVSTLLYPINGFSNGCWKSVAPVNAGDPPLGTSWRRIDVPGVPNGNDMGAYEIDPLDKTHVFGFPHSNTGNFYESHDSAETWAAMPLPTGTPVARLHLLDSATLLALYDWSSGVNPRLGKKSGSTWTWTEVFTKNEMGTTVPGQETFHGDSQIFVDRVNKVGGNDVIYTGGPEGIQRSADNGATWVKLSTPLDASQGLIGTPTKLYSMSSFANNTSGFPPKFMVAARNPGSPGSSWTAPTIPVALNNGWLRAAVATDGANYVLVGGMWNAGIWIYIEP